MRGCARVLSVPHLQRDREHKTTRRIAGTQGQECDDVKEGVETSEAAKQEVPLELHRDLVVNMRR